MKKHLMQFLISPRANYIDIQQNIKYLFHQKDFIYFKIIQILQTGVGNKFV